MPGRAPTECRRPLGRAFFRRSSVVVMAVIVVVPTADADLPADFAAGERRGVDICVPQMSAENPQNASEVACCEILPRIGGGAGGGPNSQNIGCGPSAGDVATMIGSVRARRPTSTAAEEHEHPAIDLGLPEVDVRRPRWAGQPGPGQSPRDAGTVLAQGTGKPAMAVYQFRWYLAEA